MTTVADAIRKVTVAMQNELESGRRSTHVDAHDLIEVLLAIADQIDPPLAPRARDEPLAQP
ncbi:MAG TPA: hypothetical protein VHX86_14535 [Tepidisphaeraceae bacterium]|jgi:hypothetical protein|nr:hypothetical protein [Tepidisphaeraceae bacterium]